MVRLHIILVVIFFCISMLIYQIVQVENAKAVSFHIPVYHIIYKNLLYRIELNNSSDSSVCSSGSFFPCQTTDDIYPNYLKSIIDKSVNLTRAYQDEIAIWNAHKYSNATMSKITEAYLPKFMSQLDQFKNTTAPAKYSKVKEDYIKSFESEIKSYQLFDVYLKTNNATANKLSTDYLSLALSFETMARNDFTLAINNNSSANSNINNNTNNSINKNPNIGNNSNQLFLQQPIVLCNQIKNHIGIQLIYPYNPLL